MNKTFSGGMSLHALITDAPMRSIAELLVADHPDLGRLLHELVDDEPLARASLIEATESLSARDARRLDDLAVRIIGLARGRSAETLARVAKANLSGADLADFRSQPDELGRSIWAHLHALRTFEDAESLQHAVHFREYAPIFASFDAPVQNDFVWSEELEARLEQTIMYQLTLEPPVRLSHLALEEAGTTHVIIVRHGGDLTSVAEHRSDGAKDWHCYCPSNEVTLIYAPSRGVVEVCADSPSVRQDVAVCFAEAGLGQDLSNKPLNFRLYDLSRFRRSLALPLVEPNGFRVESASVVEVETRPYDPVHRLSLKVTPNDDIEAVIERMLGQHNVFQRKPITRVAIAVRYWPTGGRRTRTLNIALSHPNRCNLRSQRDPELRRLGYELLEHWGVMQALHTPTPEDERQLLPRLLKVYDLGEAVMTEHELRERGFDPAALASHGFIAPSGRFDSMVLDEDDGGPEVVAVRPGLGDTIEFDDAKGTAWQPKALVSKYAINHRWVEEVILRQLFPDRYRRTIARPLPELVLLGEIGLGEEHVPCYLARGLTDVRTIRRLDAHLRGQASAGIGLILNAGAEGPACLGTNVVLSMPSFLGGTDDGTIFDIEAMRIAFSQGKQRARGGLTVELVRGASDTAVLYVPGKEPLLLVGNGQVSIFERLVRAYHDGTLAVRTAELMDGTGSDSPSQAFHNWKTIFDRCIGSPRKGLWQLLV